jgi:hypothetical protein
MSNFANVNVGSSANDRTGDPLRNAFQKIDQNFAEIASGNSGVVVNAPVSSVAGRTGNVQLYVNDVAGAASIAYVTQVTGGIDLQGNIDNLTVGLAELTNTVAGITGLDTGFISNINLLLANTVSQQSQLSSIRSDVDTNTSTITEILNGNAQFENLVPAGNLQYDLGSPTLWWRSLYVGSNTVVGNNLTVGGLTKTTGGSYNANPNIITSTTTLGPQFFGGMVEMSGTGSYTVTLPSPITYSGAMIAIWLNTSYNITLNTPAGNFYGPSGSNTNTLVINQTSSQYWHLWSDGYNWAVFGIATV